MRALVQLLKRKPWLISLGFVAVVLSLAWITGRERPHELTNVSREVVDTLAAKSLTGEPKFRNLRTTLKRQITVEGIPVEIRIVRTEEHQQHGIAKRREEWFHENPLSPIREVRSFVVGGFLSLDYDERSPLPFFGRFMKEEGWLREKIIALRINENREFPGKLGGVLDFTKITETQLNAYTGLREKITQHTRCTVEGRTQASRIHPQLDGEALQVNCRSELEVRTEGGIPPKETIEKAKRITAYYYVEQWGWFVPWRYSLDAIQGSTDAKKRPADQYGFPLESYKMESALVSFELN